MKLYVAMVRARLPGSDFWMRMELVLAENQVDAYQKALDQCKYSYYLANKSQDWKEHSVELVKEVPDDIFQSDERYINIYQMMLDKRKNSIIFDFSYGYTTKNRVDFIKKR